MHIEVRARPRANGDGTDVSRLTVDGHVIHPEALEWSTRPVATGFVGQAITLRIDDAALPASHAATIHAIDAASFRELEHVLTAKASRLRGQCDQSDPLQRAAARDLSIAITALEDAGIRFTRGLAGIRGVRSDVDLERMDAETERWRFAQAVADDGEAQHPTGEPGGEAGDDTGAGAS